MRRFAVYMMWFLFVLSPGFASEVTFIVTVPSETAATDIIYIWGNAPALGNFDINAVFLNKTANRTWELQVELTANETIIYKYSKGSQSTLERGPIGGPTDFRILTVPDGELVVPDTVYKWPRVGPYLSWVNDPQTTMTITWENEREGTGSVEWGLVDSYGFTDFDSTFGKLHSVELSGLTPSTTYHYRVLSSTGETGDDHTFSTAKFFTEPFTFVAYGDTRTNDVYRAEVASRIININPDLVFNTGDLVENGWDRDLWRKWFTTNQVLLEDRPFFNAIGNHEENASLYYKYWHFPGNEQWYSLDYGNAHFICLNTETNLDGNQKDWLEADLKTARDSSSWIFVFFHQPPYSSGSHGSNLSIRQSWCSLFEKYEVDIVFNGHDHDYERSLINGVYYIVTGGGGAPLHNVGSNSWTLYSESTLHCTKISIDYSQNNSQLILEAIKPDGTVFDSLTINKGTINVATDENSGLARAFQLHQNYPNPFNPQTTIRYELPINGNVTLDIVDLNGRVIRTILDEYKQAGTYALTWDAQNVSSGIYFFRLQAENNMLLKKCVVLK
jgi:hypothetical protein